MTLYEELKWRGLVKDVSSPEIEKKLNEEIKELEPILQLD